MFKFRNWMNNGRFGFVVLALALSAGATGCGDDSAVTGNQSAGGADGAGLGDGALTGDDAGNSDGSTAIGDGILTADGVVSTVCGNGKCEGPVENSGNCPADCSPIGGPDATTGPAVCGNGVCEGPDETMFLCPADCKTAATGQEACKHKACQPQYDACSADAACMTAIACFNAGGGNECVTSQQVGQEVNALTQCVQKANCKPGGLMNCGNGTCDLDESELTCPADCKTAVNPQETCLQQNCATDYKACQADATCVKIVDCVENAILVKSDPNACFQGMGGPGGGGMSQVTQGFLGCAQQSQCLGGGGGGGGGGTTATCGNGKCDGGETMLTCPKDCTQPTTPTEACYHKACPSQYAACSADPACIKAVDCFNTGGNPQQCGNNANQSALNQCVTASGCANQGGGGGGGLPNCGNGVCDPDELVLTCPADCKTPTDPQETCLQKSCATQYKACAADPACVKVVDCVNNNQNNPQQCMQGGGMSGTTGGLFQCGQQANCFGGGGGGGGTVQTTCQGNCGTYTQTPGSCQCDDKCTANGDCCKDYASLCGTTTTPVCGDGTCAAPQETAANCAADCAPPPPKPCKTIKDCGATEVCCGLASGSVCTPTGQCK